MEQVKPFGELTKDQSPERRARVDAIKREVEEEHSAVEAFYQAAVDTGARAAYQGFLDNGFSLREVVRAAFDATTESLVCSRCSGLGVVEGWPTDGATEVITEPMTAGGAIPPVGHRCPMCHGRGFLVVLR